MLTSITLENFKSFRKAAIPLGPFTLLVGTNASGKSNLRDAFRFLHGVGRGYSLAEILGEKYGEGGELQWKGLRGGTREVVFGGGSEFSIETTLRVPIHPVLRRGVRRLRYQIAVAIESARAAPRVARELFYSGRRMYFDSHPSDNPPKQQDEEHLIVHLSRGGNYRRMGPALPVLSSSPAILQVARKAEKQPMVQRFAGSTLQTLRSMRFLDLSPDAARLPSLPGRQVLGDRGENLSSVLQSICQDPDRMSTLLEWVRALTPLDVVDFDFPQDFAGRILVHLVEQGGRKISAHSASDGTLRFLAILAALLDTDTARFYFFEEIENGIHPTRLHLLVQLIEQQCRTRDVQVIATTHSPQLLGFLSPESRESALLIYRLRGADESSVRKVIDLPDLKRVLETQDLARLHASGWLEDMVELMADDAGEAAQ
ncbi:putative ATPase [Sorangium cellulosum So ce56]|uniref:ATPase n=1 Tax=Sorangium cellulosum (strain So ce56) TaxID=448385 RepID=A9EUL6_SORC5|nr:ATP-binding protein [Sorangium cellulosum]CAN91110.1 putative ATPase [Sorangium cellulosum So ce56]